MLISLKLSCFGKKPFVKNESITNFWFVGSINWIVIHESQTLNSCSDDSYQKKSISVNIYNRNIRKRCEICSKLTVKAPERRQWRRRHSSVFTINFKHITHLFCSVSFANSEQVNIFWEGVVHKYGITFSYSNSCSSSLRILYFISKLETYFKLFTLQIRKVFAWYSEILKYLILLCKYQLICKYLR